MAITRPIYKYFSYYHVNLNGFNFNTMTSFRFLHKCCDLTLSSLLIPFQVQTLAKSSKALPCVSRVATTRKFHSSNSVYAKRDYYEVLGLTRNCSSKDVKKAYYQLAKKYHPDTNKNDPNAAKKFQEVSEAYEVLSDEAKRKQYDQWGTTSEQMGMGGGRGSQAHDMGGFSWQYRATIDPQELFRKIFGDSPFSSKGFEDDFAESRFGYGASEEVIMKLTFSQAARGINKDIYVNVVETCPKCQGSRSEPGTRPIRCTYCNGSGYETVSTGPFVMKSTCRYCSGSRMLIKYPCTECEGKGSTVQRKKVTVPVPPGVEDGQTVRMLVGQKEIFITFQVEKSDYFRRDEADVHTDAEISLSQALLGGTIKIQGVYEDHFIQIMPGTSSHTRIRLNGKGLKKPTGSGTGDHYVHIKIAIPKKLTEKQKELVKSYATLEQGTPGTIHGLSSSLEDDYKDIETMAGSEQQSNTGFFSKLKKNSLTDLIKLGYNHITRSSNK
ncbi:protein tumorous imaginal discs, mitochondrial-like isoform X1 [Rhodnius prolixus]|uniref:protein tumorous imaginal discs, mitochondrial-like isoform X1 n=1 Tax=Rhodnius prolixus TaxID=13249 RepID=UPI003D18D521